MLTAGFPNIINDECISAGIKTEAAQKQLTAITSESYSYVFHHLFEQNCENNNNYYHIITTNE